MPERSSQPQNGPRRLARLLRLLPALLAAIPLLLPLPHLSAAGDAGTVTVSVDPGHPANTFVPTRALGGGIDGHEKGETERLFTPENLRAMRSAGLKPLTYRLRTELGVETWHWNPKGTWCGPHASRGYWASDPHAGATIDVSYGYRLPRRGNTVDQANNDGYSRLDDGDPATFWKSNPYLDRRYTHEDNALHAQWTIIDFGEKVEVNALRILWSAPYARRYQVKYWLGWGEVPEGQEPPKDWLDFPNGKVEKGRGGLEQLRLAPQPVALRYLQVRMLESSGTGPAGSTDVRDRLGFAIRELYAGVLDADGRFTDLIRHGKGRDDQTSTNVSSTDPWHTPTDRDENTEQPGFDRIFATGLTNGLPMLTPTGLLYDTPENAAAELKWLRGRGYPVHQVELGEEADGQFVEPEDYGALYLQFADALHKVDPALQLGGPSFQTTVGEARDWPGRNGPGSWTRRFLAYLKARKRLGDYRFFSFEWYPYDDVTGDTAAQLAEHPERLSGMLAQMQKDGLSRSLPWMITEYGFSAFAAPAEVDRTGALLNAETVGLFLTLGGDQAYLYGYTPSQLLEQKPGVWGQNMLFQADGEDHILHRMATYYGTRLLTQEWTQPGDGRHQLFPAASDLRNDEGQPLVTAYALRRPDGKWSLLLLNKDPQRALSVRVRLRNARTRAEAPLRGAADLYQLGPEQYVWHPMDAEGYPNPELPPAHTILTDASAPVTLPPYSLTVLRGASPDFKDHAHPQPSRPLPLPARRLPLLERHRRR